MTRQVNVFLTVLFQLLRPIEISFLAIFQLQINKNYKKNTMYCSFYIFPKNHTSQKQKKNRDHFPPVLDLIINIRPGRKVK